MKKVFSCSSKYEKNDTVCDDTVSDETLGTLIWTKDKSGR